MIYQADDSSFQREVLNHRGSVLVEFFTSGCAPCRQLEPHLQAVAERYAGRVKVVKVKSDDSRSSGIVQSYNVRMAPTLIMFVDGHPHRTLHGAPPPNRLDSLAQEFA